MRVIIRASSDDTFSSLLKKIKGTGLEICKENKKWNFVAVKIPKTQTNVMFELLEIGGTIERDIRNDLD